MTHPTEPISLDPEHLLLHQIHYQVANSLLHLLPPPLEDTPESLAARNEAAMARVSELRPVNADEIEIALHYVLSRAQALDVMAGIRKHVGDAVREGQLMRQFALMERTAHADRRLLLHVQAARLKREAAAGAAETDAWTAYIARRRLQQAVAQGPVPCQPEGPASPADPPPHPAEPAHLLEPTHPVEPSHRQVPTRQPEAARQPEPPASPPPPQAAAPRAPSAAQSAPAAAAPAPSARRPSANRAPMRSPASEALLTAFAMAVTRRPDRSRDLAAEAERYAIAHPRHARLIRQSGELPPDCGPDAPDEDLIYAILTTDSPTLRSFDPAEVTAA